MYVKVAKRLEGREKAKVSYLRIKMVVTDDFVIVFRRYITLNKA